MLVVLGPAIGRRVAARAAARGGLPDHGAPWVWPAVLGTGVYGGYFGAAQGVLLMAILGIGVDDDLQRHNATKNVLAAARQRRRRADLHRGGRRRLGRRRADRGRRRSSAARSGPASVAGCRRSVLRVVIVVVGVVALVSLLTD